MKKHFQAAGLIILAASAIATAALSRQSRSNHHYPHEWEKVISFPQLSYMLSTTVASTQSLINKK